MKILLSISISTLLIFIACSNPNVEDRNGVVTISQKKDTLEIATTFEITKTVSALNEKDLNNDTTGIIETRFYFFQPRFKGLHEFYKINYSDSSLCLKEFTLVEPDGSGNDSIYSTKTIKLANQDFKKINILLDKSMFWSLKTLIESTPYFDHDTYIYESVRFEKGRKTSSKRHHHFVYNYAPTNKDFINFGQYLRFLARQKNTYNDKE